MMSDDPKRQWVERVLGVRFDLSGRSSHEEATAEAFHQIAQTVLKDLAAVGSYEPGFAADAGALLARATELGEKGKFDAALVQANKAADMVSRLFRIQQNKAYDVMVNATADNRRQSDLANAESIWAAAWTGAAARVQAVIDSDGDSAPRQLSAALSSIFTSYQSELATALAAACEAPSTTQGRDLVGLAAEIATRLHAELAADKLVAALERQGVSVRPGLLKACDRVSELVADAVQE
jgi:hypothetical protein